MKVAEVRRRIAEIASVRGDDEHAHVLEDSLRRDVLQAIADGDPNAAELARECILSEGIQFSRWCA